MIAYITNKLTNQPTNQQLHVTESFLRTSQFHTTEGAPHILWDSNVHYF